MKYCVVIPTYNNEKTLAGLLADVLEYTNDVIVVDDGSSDSTAQILCSFAHRIHLIKHEKNLGKGIALRNAFSYALDQKYEYAISIDSDGQHFASDLPLFIEEIMQDRGALLIGARNMEQENVPGKSSFGNKFSNFWYHLETGIKLQDTQSGYRAYPLYTLRGTRYFTSRFEFEIEVIVKAAWKGINVKNIPICVHYEAGNERISHFRPFKDFSRISILNTWLVIQALAYYIPRRLIRSLSRENISSFIQKHFFDKSEPRGKKAASIGFGVFMGIFPVWGYQMLLGILLAHFMKMNKALFLLAANISIPPMIPVIIYFSHKAGGLLIEEPANDLLFTGEITMEKVKDNLYQYLLGAVFLAFVSGLFAGGLTYLLLWKRKLKI